MQPADFDSRVFRYRLFDRRTRRHGAEVLFLFIAGSYLSSSSWRAEYFDDDYGDIVLLFLSPCVLASRTVEGFDDLDRRSVHVLPNNLAGPLDAEEGFAPSMSLP